MEKCVKAEILEKVDELVLLLKKDPKYLRYQEISKQMKNNTEIMSIISEVKLLQKKIVNFECALKDVSNLNSELTACLNELENYPIYQEYSYLLEDLNVLFQGVKSILEIHINDIVK